jgi:hypothetical protein
MSGSSCLQGNPEMLARKSTARPPARQYPRQIFTIAYIRGGCKRRETRAKCIQRSTCCIEFASDRVQLPVASFPEDRNRFWFRALVAVCCIALVLIATTAEAGHSCEPVPVQTHHGSQVNAVLSNGGPCLLCLGVHSPGLAAPISPLAPVLISTEIPAAILPNQRGSLSVFALYIRPPPAL